MFVDGVTIVWIVADEATTISCVRAVRTEEPLVPVIVNSYRGFDCASVGMDKVETACPPEDTRTVGGVKK